MPLIGTASFPGIASITAASASLSHGISPGVISVQCAPNAALPANDGDFVMACGGTTIRFASCRVDKASLQVNTSNAVIGFSLLDRRWKWKFGEVSGLYNQRLALEGQLQSETEKSPQELAELCLAAMKERRYDVSQLPNDTRPMINWDHDNPAQALANLAETLGCRVVLRLDDSVAIMKAGVGAMLPKEGATQDGITIDPPDGPDSIKLVGGPSRYQADMLLEAVGIDLDGAVKRIDDLSYKPAAGWGKVEPRTMIQLQDNKKARDLARQSVYRWYRVPYSPKGPDERKLELPGYGKVLTVSQLFLENQQVLVNIQTERVMLPGGVTQEKEVKKPLPARVFGYYWPGTNATGNYADNLSPTDGQPLYKANDSNLPRWSADAADVRYGWSLNALQYRVEFSEPVFRWERQNDGTFLLIPARLVLRCAVSIRDTKTRVLVRWTRERKTGLQNGTGAKIIKRDEIVLTHFPTYGFTTNIPVGVKSNKGDVEIESDFVRADGVNVKKPAKFEGVEREADHYLDAAEAAYQFKQPQTLTYHGLVPISPDGAVQQVGWTISSGGHPSTTASRNDEFDVLDVPYAERRFHEKLGAGKIDEILKQAAERRGFDWVVPFRDR